MTSHRLAVLTASSAAAAAMLLGSVFTIVTPQPVSALPNSLNCQITTYFNNAGHDTEVGVRTTCPGGGNWGRVTRYREVEVIKVDFPKGPNTGSPGNPPCEFLAAGCSNLPTRRH